MSTKKAIFTILLALLIALIASTGGFFANKLIAKKPTQAEISLSQRVKEVKNNLLEIKCGSVAATGFVLGKSDEGVIAVTCWHAVKEDAASVEIRLNGSPDFIKNGITLLGYDADFDVAVYEIKGDFAAKNLVLSQNYAAGESVFLLGNSLGEGIGVFDGVISIADDVVDCVDGTPSSNINGKSLPSVRVTAAVNAGSSGAPLFDYDGKLVGMGFYQVYGTLDRPVLDMNYAIPGSVVKAIVERAKEARGPVQRQKVKLSSKIVTVSGENRRVLEAFYPDLEEKITFVATGKGVGVYYSGENFDDAKKVIALNGKKVNSLSDVVAEMIELGKTDTPDLKTGEKL